MPHPSAEENQKESGTGDCGRKEDHEKDNYKKDSDSETDDEEGSRGVESLGIRLALRAGYILLLSVEKIAM